MLLVSFSLIKKKLPFLSLLIALVFSFLSSSAQTPVVLDNFDDGNINLNPAWTLTGNAPTISSGILVTPGFNYRMFTPLAIPCQEWGFDVKTSTSNNTSDFRYYFLLRDNSDPTNAASKSYFLEYLGNTGTFQVWRQENNLPVLIGSYDGPTTTNWLQVKITMSVGGDIKVYVGGIEVISVTDATYCQTTSQWQMIRVFGSSTLSTADPYNADNFYYVAMPCTNPATGGEIGLSQNKCQAFDPTPLTDVTAPSCFYDVNGQPLQYQWQSSTNLVNGFSDIIGATTSNYDPPLTSINTFYRRRAKVSCAPNWVESDVVQVNADFKINSKPNDTTLYVQANGDGIFSVEVNFIYGNIYQWQVSTNGGSGWTNITSGTNGYIVSSVQNINYRSFLQVTKPTLSMDGYLYRCIVTNPSSGACSVTSPSATLYVKNQLVATANPNIACDSWNATTDILFVVNGVGTLNKTTNLLRQINLTIGSGLCKKNLSTYDFTLIAPNGAASLMFIDNFTTTGSVVWANIKFRDHPSLERINQYSSFGQANYFPYSIGYYAVETDGSLANAFNGINANGTWILRITENSASSNDGASISKAELIFGADLVEKDVSGNAINNSCQLATCIGADQNILIGTNNGYSGGDPNYPGGSPAYSGDCDYNDCEWNQDNNNSAWFYFFATSSTAYLTVSGMAPATNPGQDDMQLMVLDGGNGCLTSGWTIPNGGCLDDEFNCPSGAGLPNNQEYYASSVIASQSGGIGAKGGIYVNGITFNTEFKLSGLTPGRRYLLVLDGNGGQNTSFYIEMQSGCAFCIFNSILPVKFESFKVFRKGNTNQLIWKTAEELNNDYFQIERSGDGINWISIMDVEGAGRDSRSLRTYERNDNKPLHGANYYRIKTVSSDEKVTYSEIRMVNNHLLDEIAVFPNPGKGVFTVSGLDKRLSHQIRVLNVDGKLIKSVNTTSDIYRFDMTNEAPGIYFIQVDGKVHLRFVNVK